MMNAEGGMMNNKQHALSFIIHPSAFIISFILSILSILLIPSLDFTLFSFAKKRRRLYHRTSIRVDERVGFEGAEKPLRTKL
jgi:hypothetical protein